MQVELVEPSLLHESSRRLLDWAGHELSSLGIQMSSREPRVRTRHWSIVAEMSTINGLVWAKQNAPRFLYEGRLLELLNKNAPEHTVELLALDAQRGYMLSNDAGHALKGQSELTFTLWETLIDYYASIQHRMSEHAPEMLAVGVPDLRATQIPSNFRLMLTLLDNDSELRKLISDEELGKLHGLESSVQRWSLQLASSALPATIEHNDLQFGNVFSQDGLRISDWGDAVLTHPFMCLHAFASNVSETLHISPSSKQISLLKRRYISHWGSPSNATLNREANLATVLGHLVNASTWLRLPKQAILEYPHQGLPKQLRGFITKASALRF